MLNPSYYEGDWAYDLLQIYTELDEAITSEIAARIARMGYISDYSIWQTQVLQDAGLLYEDVLAQIAEKSGKTNAQIKRIFRDAGNASVTFDNSIYEAAGLSPMPLRLSPSMMQILSAGLKKTANSLKNLTLTTANTAQTAYISACSAAYMQASSGAMSYTEAIRKAVKSAVSGGTTVRYPSGHRDQLDVAVRRSVLTGVSQTCGVIATENAKLLGCDLMEITASADSRPEHAVWQGRIVSLSGQKGYLTLSDIGYGDVRGFKGANCGHDWYPFIEGVSRRMYADAQLEELKNSDLYDQKQKQRGMERGIRATKRELAGLDSAIKNADPDVAASLKQDFEAKSIKLKGQEAAMRDYCKKNNLLTDNSRTQAAYGTRGSKTTEGFGRSTAQKAVQADARYYTGWKKSVGGDGFPEKVAKYRELRYNNLEEYGILRGYVNSVNKGSIPALTGYDNYKAIVAEVKHKLVGATTVNGITISGYREHFIERVIGTICDPTKGGKPQSGVAVDVIYAALTRGASSDVRYKTTRTGIVKPSQVFTSPLCQVTINPDTKELIQCTPLIKC